MPALNLHLDKSIIIGKTFKSFKPVSTFTASQIIEILRVNSLELSERIREALDPDGSTNNIVNTNNYAYFSQLQDDRGVASRYIRPAGRSESLGYIYDGPEIILQNTTSFETIAAKVDLSDKTSFRDKNEDNKKEYDGSVFIISPKFSVGFDCGPDSETLMWPPDIFQPDGTTEAAPVSYWKHWLEIRSLPNLHIVKSADDHYIQSYELIQSLLQNSALDRNMGVIKDLCDLKVSTNQKKDFHFAIMAFTDDDERMWTRSYSRATDAGNEIRPRGDKDPFVSWVNWLMATSRDAIRGLGASELSDESDEINSDILWCTLEESVSGVFAMSRHHTSNLLAMNGIAFQRSTPSRDLDPAAPRLSLFDQHKDDTTRTPSSLITHAMCNQVLKWI